MGIKIDITPKDLKTVKDLLKHYLPNTLVWAFGSRVKFTAKPTSDLDLAAFISKEQELKFSLLKEALEESSIPFRIDLHNWHELPETFHKNIESSFMVLQEDTKEEKPSEWKTYKLGEIYDFASGLSKSKEFFGKGYDFVTFKDIFQNYFLPERLTALVETNEKERKSCSVKKGDVFLTRTSENDTELGLSSVALKDYPNATFNGFTKRLRPKGNIEIIPEFAGFYFRSPKFRAMLSQYATMTTRASLNNEILINLTIDLPKKDTQVQIGGILKSLDDKIELNLQMNQTLEAMAQAIFKEWFVDFKFPDFNGELVDGLPKGWKTQKLGKICEIKYGKDHKHLGDGNIPVYGSGGIMRFADKALYENESILIPRKGTLTNLFYVSKPFWSVDTMFYTIIKNNAIKKYLFYLLKTLNLASMNVGSAVPSLTTEVLNKIDIMIPENSILVEFEKIISSFYSKMEDNNNQIQSLTQTRDTLLPKLMSGKIEVK